MKVCCLMRSARPPVGLALLSVVVLSGCGGSGDSAYVAVAEARGTRAEVTVPAGEARSIGTYRLSVRTAGRADKELTVSRDGTVYGLWVDDLYGADVPEVVVATSSAGSGSYGLVDVYEITRDGLVRSRPNELDEEQLAGYAGHDRFEVAGGRLLRSFPVYREGDANASPGGESVTFWYDFPEAAWKRLPDARSEEATD
ncbi:MAG: hypothetical protein JXB46_08780 [Candidatus Eisenbacteria bacterium]|nr:hypothetical protein [Candidatus Eisenbacteria bacterium]